MTYDEIKDYLINGAGYSERVVEDMDGFDLIDTWLKYEGIVGYTCDIITAVLSVRKHHPQHLTDWED